MQQSLSEQANGYFTTFITVIYCILSANLLYVVCTYCIIDFLFIPAAMSIQGEMRNLYLNIKASSGCHHNQLTQIFEVME